MAFRENAIDETVLPNLTDQDLEKLNVLLGHRRELLRIIASLENARKASSAIPPAASPTTRFLKMPPSVMFLRPGWFDRILRSHDPEDLRRAAERLHGHKAQRS